MPLEQITTEMDVQTPGKKKKLVSMKKVERINTDIKRNVPVSQVQKDDDYFAKGMIYAKKKDMEEIKARELKAANKIKMLKKL